MSGARPVLAFLRPGPHPFANTSLPEHLTAEFPDFDVHVIDVVDRLRARRSWVAAAGAAALGHYGLDIARGRRNPKDALLRTPLVASMLRRTALSAMAELPRRPTVTMQIQSLFDAHLPGVPHFVYTDHTHLTNRQYADFDPSLSYARSWVRAERSIYRNARCCFARSSHVARSLTEDYGVPAEQVHVVYAGINVRTDRYAPARAGACEQIAFVGVDWQRKGGPELLAAFAAVRERHPDATLAVVGCPPGAPTPGVRWLGRLPMAEVAAVLSDSGIFCLPTRVEPFGIAVLEAMAARLPVIGTTVGAIGDMVRDGESGLLITPGDVPALTNALRRLLADPQLRDSAGACGQQIVRERYTWPQVASRMREVMHGYGACPRRPASVSR